MGSDKARRRRTRQLEAQFEKKSMKRAHFSLSCRKHGAKVEKVSHYQDDGMTNALRKMLAMKEGRKQIHRNAEHTHKKSQRNGDEAIKARAQGQGKPVDKASAKSNDASMDDGGKKKAIQHEKEEEKEMSASKLKRKAFMKKKGKKTRDDDESYEPDPGPVSAPVFGEQADRPIEATLKRRHWVDSETAKPLTLSMKNIGSRMDSKALAALYRSSRGNRVKEKQVATMDTLKKLVKSTTMDSHH